MSPTIHLGQIHTLLNLSDIYVNSMFTLSSINYDFYRGHHQEEWRTPLSYRNKMQRGQVQKRTVAFHPYFVIIIFCLLF